MHALQAQKQQLRKCMLRRLGQAARAAPQKLHEDSLRVCAALEEYLTQHYLSRSARNTQSLCAQLAVLRTVQDTDMNYNNGKGDRGGELDNDKRSQGSAEDASSTLYLLAYHPMYYEIDLLPLLHRLWRAKERQGRQCINKENDTASASSEAEALTCNVCVMLPVVIDPAVNAVAAAAACGRLISEPTNTETSPNKAFSTDTAAQASLRHALLFVEVYDSHDLSTSFVPQGRYNLCEIRPDLLHDILVYHDGRQSMRETEPSRPSSNAHCSATHATATEHRGCRPRRILGCDTWAHLFPHAAANVPPTWLEWGPRSISNPIKIYSKPLYEGAATSQCEEQSFVVVLTPGVCFSALDGARLGKGGGFYDRFIHYQRQASQAVQFSKDKLITNDKTSERQPINTPMSSEEKDDTAEAAATTRVSTTHHECKTLIDQIPTVRAIEIIGVATEMQVDRGHGFNCTEIQDKRDIDSKLDHIHIATCMEHDVPVDAIVTPRNYVQVVGENCACN